MSYNPPPPPPGGPPPSEPPLPPGWTRLFDPSGVPYYHNAATNTTSWTPPTQAPQPPPPPPPGPPPPPAGPPPPYQQTSSYHQQQTYPPASHPQYPPQQQHFPPSQYLPQGTPQHAPSHQMQQQPAPYGIPSHLSHASSQQPPSMYPHPQPSHMGHQPPNMPPSHMQPQPTHAGSMGGLSQGMSMLSMGPSMSMGAAPGAPGAVYISLEMRAVGLKDKDIIGKSDPICYVNVPDQRPNLAAVNTQHKVNKWKIIGQTEVLENTTAPSWAQRVKVPFHFEQHQLLRFVVIDVDNKKTLRGDKLGQVVVSLAEIVRNGLITLKLTKDNGGGGKFGELIVRAHDDNQAGKVRVKLALSGANLDKKDTFGKSDPYYLFKQVVGKGHQGTSTLYKSQYLKNTINPTWEPHTLMIATAGMPWNQVQLQLSVYDWDKYTPHDLIGEASFSLTDLTTSPSFDLVNAKKAAKSRRYKNSGQIKVHRADAVEFPNFISYLQGGLRLNSVVAIDFTASNRPINNPSSLHYIRDPQRPSKYAQALNAIGTILMGYIPDGYVTALGFGAILPGQGNVPSFDFALTGQPDARVQGVPGLLAAYEQAVNNVTLAGPTNFAPLLRNAMGAASAYPVSQTNQHFTIVVILTDGVITDLQATIDTIIECSYDTPMAIVIVGIGDADFSAMERLDADNTVLRNDSGRQAKHDIVQFTKFEENKSIEILAADVLHELPDRVVEYMIDAGIKPNPPTF